jgi:hypothetical protein
MENIAQKKKELQQKINRLKEKEFQIKEKERKQRTRRLIEMGGLIEKANISFLSKTQLLGALLFIKNKSQDEKMILEWENAGINEFEKNKGSMKNEKPIVIQFSSEPDPSIRKKIRSLGMRWNSVRKEWEGIADPEALTLALQGIDMNLKELDIPETNF